MPDDQRKPETSPVKQKKKKPTTPVVDPLSDAYKFGMFCVRTVIAATTGKVVGDWKVDAALGDALSQLYPPSEVAEGGTHMNILLNGMNGAWQAAKGEDEKWE